MRNKTIDNPGYLKDRIRYDSAGRYVIVELDYPYEIAKIGGPAKQYGTVIETTDPDQHPLGRRDSWNIRVFTRV